MWTPMGFGAIAFLLAALAAPVTTPSPCSQPADRQLDFWIGRWTVRDASNRVVGRSEVRRIAGGCALLEDWTGTDGFLGTSITGRDPVTGRWRQTWVDSRQQRIEYVGGRRGPGFEFSSDHRTASGKPVLIRLTLWPEPPDRVRQRWEQSIDGGKSWRVDFDGTYAQRQ